MASCSLPGDSSEDDEESRIPAGHVELGLGIHGEPGVSKLKTQNSEKVITTLVEKLQKQFKKSDKLALLINNLGGVSPLEMNQLTKELVHSALGKSIRYLIGPAALVSALDMKGFSLSAIALTDDIEKALLAQVEASRSEEHTSELQSLRHLVCRLLLEKKKKTPSTVYTSMQKTWL